VYPGKDMFPLANSIEACGLETIATGTFGKINSK
jgi:hypothetical protein